jgi:hypothetical protein
MLAAADGWTHSLPSSDASSSKRRSAVERPARRASRMLADDSMAQLSEGWADKVARLEADMDSTTAQLDNLRLKQRRLYQTRQVRRWAARTRGGSRLHPRSRTAT